MRNCGGISFIGGTDDTWDQGVTNIRTLWRTSWIIERTVFPFISSAAGRIGIWITVWFSIFITGWIIGFTTMWRLTIRTKPGEFTVIPFKIIAFCIVKIFLKFFFGFIIFYMIWTSTINVFFFWRDSILSPIGWTLIVRKMKIGKFIRAISIPSRRKDWSVIMISMRNKSIDAIRLTTTTDHLRITCII